MNYLIARVGGDWESLYGLSKGQVIEFGGLTLLLRHNSSVCDMVMKELPELDWKIWKFARAPKDWWRNLAKDFEQGNPTAKETLRQFILWIESQASISSPEQWVDRLSSLKSLGRQVNPKLAHLGGLRRVLKGFYPSLEFPHKTSSMQHATYSISYINHFTFSRTARKVSWPAQVGDQKKPKSIGFRPSTSTMGVY